MQCCHCPLLILVISVVLALTPISRLEVYQFDLFKELAFDLIDSSFYFFYFIDFYFDHYHFLWISFALILVFVFTFY